MPSMIPATIHFLPDAEPELTAEVMESLARLERRAEGRFTNQRGLDRFAYPAEVTVRTIVGLHLRSHEQEEEQFCEATFPAYGRNLSRGGVGFVFAPRYLPELPGEDSILLHAEEVLAVNKPLEVGLPIAGGGLRWVAGRLVRRRHVLHGYLDCGVRFEAPDAADASAG